MNVRLSPQSEELVNQQLAQGRFHSAEELIERALRAFAQRESGSASPAQREAVEDMLEFVKQNRARLEDGLSVKDLIHEGHRV
ncbi:MAG TPA: hypothetical protein VFA33_29855 [Bryobacteraceae bacterium]|nr:hypothetical protein [Bryobacteraceae bacterium]